MNENILISKTLNFAARIIKLHNYLIKDKKETIIAKQIIRSGTSIGANISEAQQAQSKRDFISKMSIALKEANETKYWLRLLKEVGSISETDSKEYFYLTDELMRILIKILKSSKEE